MQVVNATEEAIAEAASRLNNGELVAFPTETVYGLGAKARSQEALKALYKAKGRPTNHPVIVHLGSLDQMDEWAQSIPNGARKLAAAMCPGPLTLILPKASHVLPEITGGQDTVGLRFPAHPVARRLLAVFADGIAAPSANKFGRLSPTSAQDVTCDFEQEIAMVLDGGMCDVGIESTIVDFTTSMPRILRPGMILPEQIEAIAGSLLRHPVLPHKEVRAPGLLASHYAPSTQLELAQGDNLERRLKQYLERGKTACVLSFQEGLAGCLRHIVAPKDSARYAHELYGNLRLLDSLGADVILVEAVPETEAWAGIADRLKRAATEEGKQ